ncbi:hypothetical protein PENDEC_c021G04346 [Penicillium decumbens]|uniref:Survival Motor Neuron Gemin2-binding domain-containing protein n=1 Tax=Penicillium decumbens TaxID=69771 RepID=A0A1V6P699_PENDC|nr:hypothetical protein PENDEC_c021G04346 [Penicillium decumbens]
MGMSKQTKHLTHEEIWDDSALLRSWDDAVEEYRLYHSIQAKGENVEDVLRQAEEAGLADEDDPLAAEEDAAGDGFIAETEEETATGSASQNPKSVAQEPQQVTENGQAGAAAPGPTSGTMSMPDALLSQVKDESLKRLMMSWYFAGYYTGLYEGQQQAKQGKS